MHIKKNNWNTNSISVLVKMHARHLRTWLYLHQHKLPSENKAQLISGSLICLDENEFLIDLVVRGIMQENEVAGCSHSGLLWRCLLVASRQEWCRVFSTDSKQRCQTVTGGESWGSWGDQVPGDIATLSLPCNRPQTPSYLCALAWFATTLQIISFNLPITQ